MGNIDKPFKSEIPTGDTSANGESGLTEARQLAFSQSSDRRIPGRSQISDGLSEKQFADDLRRSQREYIGVESGRNPQTGEADGKPMASSDTLMRAEAHMVYAALHGHNARTREKAAVSLKGEQYDPGNEESVHQAYLSSQRKHERVSPTATAAQIEDARIHHAYVADKKHGTKIEFD
ncbi:hypothetical protein BH10CYA1_BH10CYA1_53020 [soil metagenome]